jgi:hypothetical protein
MNNVVADHDWDGCALVLGHPGHELRIFQTVARLRPVAYLLTDGSGGTGHARTESTRNALASIGVNLAAPFPPPLPDAVLYQSLLSGNHRVLCDWTRALTEDLRRREIRTVLADAAEGFNPAHDVCRAIARAARQAAGVARGYAYLLEGRPDSCPAGKEVNAITVAGRADELSRKYAAMADYPEIQDEVQRATAAWGPDAFAREWIFLDDAPVDCPPDELPPAYERFGEERVRAGKYSDVIRYDAHVRPFLATLRSEFGG